MAFREDEAEDIYWDGDAMGDSTNEFVSLVSGGVVNKELSNPQATPQSALQAAPAATSAVADPDSFQRRLGDISTPLNEGNRSMTLRSARRLHLDDSTLKAAPKQQGRSRGRQPKVSYRAGLPSTRSVLGRHRPQADSVPVSGSSHTTTHTGREATVRLQPARATKSTQNRGSSVCGSAGQEVASVGSQPHSKDGGGLRAGVPIQRGSSRGWKQLQAASEQAKP